jgi:hypothetical protein
MLFIFLDGVGIGEKSDKNPFVVARSEFLPFYAGNNGLPDGTPVKAIDAVLGVEGQPQSATGQTSLFTGENVPALLKEHIGSYPNKLMRKIIKEKNILSRLREKKLNAGYINAYPFYTRLFTKDHVDIGEDGVLHFSDAFPSLFKRRISVTTCMLIANRQVPFSETDIIREKAIYQDYSNVSLTRMIEKMENPGRMKIVLRETGLSQLPKLPHFTPGKAAEILFKASRGFDFLLYEYFQTDISAHRSSFDERVELIGQLNRFIGTLISLLDKERDTLLLTSDHGNLEDSTTLAHTRNWVPLVVWGRKSDELRQGIESLIDVTPAIVEFFS